MDAAALAISICAFVLSLAGFGWTVYEWQRSGARLNVNVTSFVTFGGMSMLGAGQQQWAVAFDVANAGRTETTVHGLGFLLPDGGAVLMSDPLIGPNPLPGQLAPGASLTFPVDLDGLLAKCKEQGIDPAKLVPYANSGHGRFEGKWAKVALDLVESRAS